MRRALFSCDSAFNLAHFFSLGFLRFSTPARVFSVVAIRVVARARFRGHFPLLLNSGLVLNFLSDPIVSVLLFRGHERGEVLQSGWIFGRSVWDGFHRARFLVILQAVSSPLYSRLHFFSADSVLFASSSDFVVFRYVLVHVEVFLWGCGWVRNCANLGVFVFRAFNDPGVYVLRFLVLRCANLCTRISFLGPPIWLDRARLHFRDLCVSSFLSDFFISTSFFRCCLSVLCTHVLLANQFRVL